MKCLIFIYFSFFGYLRVCDGVFICEAGDQDCTGPLGQIVSPQQTQSNIQYSVISSTGKNQAVYYIMYAQDINIHQSSNCKLEIDGKTITGKSDLTLLLSTPSTIKAGYKTGCKWTIWYITYEEERNNIQVPLTDLAGKIMAPEEVEPELSIFGYKMNTHALWIITNDDPRAFININITSLDLGTDSIFLNTIENNNKIMSRDHLIIGAGSVIFNGSDQVFYGQSDSLIQLSIPSNEAHIFFVSDYHHEEATGFTIKYEVKIDESTTSTSTIETTTIKELDNTWAPINNVSSSEDLSTAKDKFKTIISVLCEEYGKENNIQYQRPVISDDVEILETMSCVSYFCLEDCVAFRFQVNIKNKANDWALTKEDLDNMINTNTKLWADKNLEVCDEHPKFKMGIILGVTVGIIVFMILVGILARVLVKKDVKVQQEQELDRRIAEQLEKERRESVTSRESRPSMPFPNQRPNKLPEDFELQDTRGYVEYDPHNNLRNYHALGFEKDLFSIQEEKKGILNHGYVNDGAGANGGTEMQATSVKPRPKVTFREKNPSLLVDSDSDVDLEVRSITQKNPSIVAEIHADDETSDDETAF